MPRPNEEIVKRDDEGQIALVTRYDLLLRLQQKGVNLGRLANEIKALLDSHKSADKKFAIGLIAELLGLKRKSPKDELPDVGEVATDDEFQEELEKFSDTVANDYIDDEDTSKPGEDTRMAGHRPP